MRVNESYRDFPKANPEGEKLSASPEDLDYYNSLRSGVWEYPADPTPAFLRLLELGYLRVLEPIRGLKGRKKSYEKVRPGRSPHETGTAGLEEFYGNRNYLSASRNVTMADFVEKPETNEEKLAKILAFLRSNPGEKFTATKLGTNVGIEMSKHPEFFAELAAQPDIFIQEKIRGKNRIRIISCRPQGGK